ncbi:MAG TPA: GntG family PLP-dependent aldolase [Calditrichia bacterium]|nr:aminotransferase class I/II-fold pyridoxal phosphate-dependent enzyme [Calditrichota bacterium]HQU71594.1 GntG family PLP-dependent aldolase [Calditrichia bacterium]HQV33351.1 GntG family PLP-dependent aldolase [Calditrichia bacterium]
MKTVDLRSDTISRPTADMRQAMAAAVVGDDVFGEDPTINALQERIAELTGKEAALFVTSGTQGNQVSLNAHTRPGQEVICNSDCHIFNYESGAAAMLSGVQLNALPGTNGVITLEQIRLNLRPADDHYPQTGLICLENTHNRAGGTIYPLEEIRRISAWAREQGISLHLDGARLWNASVATGISIAEYAAYFDSVSLCFSKGLGAPVGSVVAGPRDFIARCHFYRKAYGGGIRQGGILAAAALYALDHHVARLAEDHARAKRLAAGLAAIPGLRVDLNTVQTNILIFEVEESVCGAAEMVGRLGEEGILCFDFGPQRIRMVFYLEIGDEDVDYTLEKTALVMARLKGGKR